MKDLSCYLAAMINLFGPLTLLILWHRKTGARFYPAIVAFITCIPVFFIGNAIRSGFSHSAPILYYIQQGILFGIFEEGAKFLVLRYFLTSYDRRTDAVSYGIGHGSYECLGCGICESNCPKHIGKMVYTESRVQKVTEPSRFRVWLSVLYVKLIFTPGVWFYKTFKGSMMHLMDSDPREADIISTKQPGYIHGGEQYAER